MATLNGKYHNRCVEDIYGTTGEESVRIKEIEEALGFEE